MDGWYDGPTGQSWKGTDLGKLLSDLNMHTVVCTPPMHMYAYTHTCQIKIIRSFLYASVSEHQGQQGNSEK